MRNEIYIGGRQCGKKQLHELIKNTMLDQGRTVIEVSPTQVTKLKRIRHLTSIEILKRSSEYTGLKPK